MFFDKDIGAEWCLVGLTWRCTPSEAIGIWSVLLFYTLALVVTLVHYLMLPKNKNNGTGTTRSAVTTTSTNGDLKMIGSLVIYFFTFVLGCLLWAVHPTWAHPIQIWWIQLLGSILLVVCTCLFLLVHIHMGDSWYPVPDQPPQLVTHGIFQYARHPMYAVFLWAAIGTLLATLNWVMAWCVAGLVLVTLPRIPAEEQILVGVFGQDYLIYTWEVSALGFPWQCLGYEYCTMTTTTTTIPLPPHRGDYNVIE